MCSSPWSKTSPQCRRYKEKKFVSAKRNFIAKWTHELASYIIEYNFSGFNRIGRVRKSMTNFPVRPLCRPAHDTNTRTDNHSAAPVDHRKAPWVRSLASPTYNLINHPNKSASDFIIALWIRCIGEWNSYIHLMSGRLEERKQWKRERERDRQKSRVIAASWLCAVGLSFYCWLRPRAAGRTIII